MGPQIRGLDLDAEGEVLEPQDDLRVGSSRREGRFVLEGDCGWPRPRNEVVDNEEFAQPLTASLVVVEIPVPTPNDATRSSISVA